MKNYFSKALWIIFPLLLLALLLAACGTISRPPFGGAPAETREPEASLNNGASIYFSSINSRGERIPYTGGPDFGGMMTGAYLTCAACHGPEARGGVHQMQMQVMEAPDIRYVALSGETGEHEEGEEEEHGAYDLEDFRLAVVEDKHPDGALLDPNMPRWQISDEDLADLLAFLKSIP